MKLVLNDPLIGGKDFHYHLFKLYCRKFCLRVISLWSSKTGCSLIFVTFCCLWQKKNLLNCFPDAKLGFSSIKNDSVHGLCQTNIYNYKNWIRLKSDLHHQVKMWGERCHFAPIRAVPIWIGASLPFYLPTTTDPFAKIMDIFLNIW